MKGIAVDASMTNKADHVSGVTPEHGNIEIDLGGTEEKSLQIGQGTVERIGYTKYPVYGSNVSSFFPSKTCPDSPPLEIGPPDRLGDRAAGSMVFELGRQMEPVWFGRMGYRTVHWGWLSIIISQIVELGAQPRLRAPPLDFRLVVTKMD